MHGEVSWSDYLEVENGKVSNSKAFIRKTRDELIRTSSNPYVVKSWRDQIIRDLAKQNRLHESKQYTAFLDELTDKNAMKKAKSSLVESAERFVEGIRKLNREGRLTHQNMMNLLQPHRMAESYAGGVSTLSFGDRLSANIATGQADRTLPRLDLSNYVPEQLATSEADSRSEVRANAEFPDWDDYLPDPEERGYKEIKELVRLAKVMLADFEQKTVKRVRSEDVHRALHDIVGSGYLLWVSYDREPSDQNYKLFKKYVTEIADPLLSKNAEKFIIVLNAPQTKGIHRLMGLIAGNMHGFALNYQMDSLIKHKEKWESVYGFHLENLGVVVQELQGRDIEDRIQKYLRAAEAIFIYMGWNERRPETFQSKPLITIDIDEWEGALTR